MVQNAALKGSNLTQAISREKFAIRWRTATYGDALLKHIDLYGSVHTLRRRTVMDSNTTVPIDNNGK